MHTIPQLLRMWIEILVARKGKAELALQTAAIEYRAAMEQPLKKQA